MKDSYDLVVVIPVGPNISQEFIIDTIDSFAHYTRSTYKIILVDDSRQNTGEEIKKALPDIDVIKTQKPLGSMVGLYFTLCLGYRHALEHYYFNILLKLDTDALVIGPYVDEEAFQLFKDQPRIAIAGQYPFDYHGQPWDIEWPRARLVNGLTSWKFIKRPFSNWALRKYYFKAIRNDYKAGESVFGGAYFMNKFFLLKLYEEGLLPNRSFRGLNLGEDHLFALLAKATGFELGTLSSSGQPFGCSWKGLPVSPEQLLSDRKKIIHSTRSWGDWKEEDIRSFFRNKRRNEQGSHDLRLKYGSLSSNTIE